MQQFGKKPGLLQKQFPTILGLGVLVVALVAGIFMFGGGTGVFAPRATPQTTPKKIVVTNVGDKSFTVTFFTDEATAGFVKYGTEPNKLTSQASDDRDQLSGAVGKYTLHHITVRGVNPGKEYYYVLGTGSNAEYDNNGQPFKLKMADLVTSPPPASKTLFGSVIGAGGTPADGAVVYVTIEGVGKLSSLVKSSGSWAISLATARTADGKSYAELADTSKVDIQVQGVQLGMMGNITTTVGAAQPVADIALSANGQPSSAVSASGSAQAIADSGKIANTSIATKSSTLPGEPAILSSDSGALKKPGLENLLSATQSSAPNLATQSTAVSTASAVLVLPAATATKSATTEATTQVLTTQPVIQGTAPPNTTVTISIHSDNNIQQTVTTNAAGSWQVDLAKLKETLDPGEHTITYSYIDPATGKEVTKTETFIVEDKTKLTSAAPKTANQLALASTPTPTKAYGTGNPYPIKSPTPTIKTDSSTRSALVSTSSGVYKSGSVGVTFGLVGFGLFLMFTGAWTWWFVKESLREAAEENNLG